jgi:SAM-dependent methyltransferase
VTIGCGNSAYYAENYARWLPENRSAPILDVGCGQGDFVRYVHGLGYRNVTAIDLDPQSIEGLQGLKGVTAIQTRADADFVTGLNMKWALIVVKQAIYYFDRHEAGPFVRALAQSLAPDGRLLVEIFNGALLSSRFTELKDPLIMTAYTDLGLKRLLEWNGLVVEEVAGVHAIRHGIKWGLYRMVGRLWFLLYRGLLILERGRDNELPVVSNKNIIAIARRG